MHQYLWLATGGKSCINDRLLVLQGRKIIAFPDIDGFKEWTEKLAKYSQLGITVSPILQQNATAEDMEAHIDISPTGSSGTSCARLGNRSRNTAWTS